MPSRCAAIGAATASERAAAAGRVAAIVGAVIASVALVPSARAQQTVKQGSFYSCVVNGKKVTSDRLIPECSATGQVEIGRDGVVRRPVPPTLTQEERADAEAKARDAEMLRNRQLDAIRRDKNLVSRFPDESFHQKARDKALDDGRNSVKRSEARLAILRAERKPLLAEAEFYPSPKTIPPKLRQQLDENEASQKAQEELIQNAHAEVGRINGIYDKELAKLKLLWAGAPLGSLGGVATVSAAAAATALPAASAPIRR